MATETRTQRSRRRMVDFNTLLRWLNVLVFVGTVAVFAEVGANAFMDRWTVVLGGVLAAQTHLALVAERRRRDPFVIVLAFITIFYYSLRLLTLLLVPNSYDLTHYPYRPADSNHALTFIVIANVCLYIGLFAAGGPSRLSIDAGDWKPRSPSRAVLLVAASIVMVYSRGKLWGGDSLPRLLMPLQVFISQGFIIAMALTFCVVYRDTLNRRVRDGLVGLIVLEMVLHTLSGSRSAIVYFVQTAMLVWLAAVGSIRLRRTAVLVAASLTPALAVVLIWSFVVASYNRIRIAHEQSAFSVSDSLDFVREMRDEMTQDTVTEKELPVLFMRVGFFDYAADRIANRRHYATVVNGPAYVRSIIDNLLTPGFDVFDQPKVSNALRFVYASLGTPSKRATDEVYQSDQLGIYGEFYILFGYASLPLFFLVGVVMKRIYVGLWDPNPFHQAVKRVVALTIFSELVNSFGLDWVAISLVQLVVAMYVYRFCFVARGSPRPSTSGSTRLAAPVSFSSESGRHV